MKRLIAAAVLAVIIAAVYFAGNLYIKNVIEKSYVLVDQCYNDYKKGENSEKTAKKLKSYWAENESLLSVFANHGSIDEVEKAINTMVIYSSTAEKEIFMEYSDTVKTLLHQLREDNSLTMHSVF